MEPRELALLHACGRIAVGAAFVLFPGLAGRRWIGADAARRQVKVLARAFGVRDLAIGLGVVIALDRGAPVRGWPNVLAEVCTMFMRGRKPSWIACRVIEYAPEMVAWEAITVAAVASATIG